MKFTEKVELRSCDIFKTTSNHILANDLNMNRIYARWVPRLLTAEHLLKRMELSNQLIKKVSRSGIRFLDRLTATDGSLFHYYNLESKPEDNALAQTALQIHLEIELFGFGCLNYPRHSLHLAPLIFAIFPHHIISTWTIYLNLNRKL